MRQYSFNYGKLGVHNRIQAIAQARLLGLVNTDAAPSRPPLQAQREPSGASRSNPEQRVSFTHSFDGTRIAFGVVGDGPPLVKVANFISHLEHDWNSPVWFHWLEELTRTHTLIHADERGSGLSDWDVADVSFEAWVRDLEAVVDAVGLQRFPMFAMSQACPVAVAFAVRHPERVSRMILHGGHARELAPQVTAPTLVLHSRGDAGVPFQEGRLLASLIPKAQFVALDSKNHLVTKQEPAWSKLTEAMRSFLGEEGR